MVHVIMIVIIKNKCYFIIKYIILLFIIYSITLITLYSKPEDNVDRQINRHRITTYCFSPFKIDNNKNTRHVRM